MRNDLQGNTRHTANKACILMGIPYRFLVLTGLIIILASVLAACASPPVKSPQNTSTPDESPAAAFPALLPEPYPVDTVELSYTNQLLLDVYSPSGKGNWPVVVVFHGSDENKNMTAYLSKRIAEQGAVVFTPTWRVKDATHFYPGLEDAACAIRFARRYAGDYGGNPDRITAVGHSAGGSAAAIMFLAPDGFEGDCLVSDGSSTADALVGLDGVYDYHKLVSEETWATNPDEWDVINPLFYLPKEQVQDSRAIFLLNSSVVMLKTMAAEFYQELIHVGCEPVLIDIPTVNHTSIIWPAPDVVIQAVVAAMIAGE